MDEVTHISQLKFDPKNARSRNIMQQAKLIKLTSLIPDPNNANKGTQRGRGMLERSLTDLGAGRSILVDKNNVAIAGNKSLECAIESGFEDGIVIETDGSQLIVVKRVDLDLSKDAKAVQLSIADNRAGEVSLEWDVKELEAIADRVDLSNYFFDEELSKMINDAELASMEDDDKEEEGSDRASSKEIDCECPACGHRFIKMMNGL